MLEARNLCHSYDLIESAGSARGHCALGPVDIALSRGERVAIIGPNGSGKTTLLRCLATQLTPSQGEIVLDGHAVRTRADGLRLRQQVGVVGQDPDNQIVASTVFEEVAFGPCNLSRSPSVIYADAAQALEACDLVGYDQRDVASLSGGERQRLAVAGVLSMHPSYLLLDEPNSMLDPLARRHMVGLIKRLAQADTGILHVTHELAEVLDYDRLLVMKEGRIVWEGLPVDLLADREVLAASGCLVTPWLRCIEGLRDEGLLARNAPWGDPRACAMAVHKQGGAAVAAARSLLTQVFSAPEATSSEAIVDGAQMLRGERLSYAYRGEESLAISNVTVRLAPGRALLVAGCTGSGKSTLAQLLAGLRVPCKGGVWIGEQKVEASMVGYAFQRAEDQLFAGSVVEDVAFGPHNRGRSKAQAREEALEALELVGLDPNRWADVSPFALSGGQMRRVALAGVLALGAPYVVFDEPTVGLDAQGCADLATLVAELRARGVGIVMVSHDIERVLPWVTDVVVLAGGTVAWEGPAWALASQDNVFDEALLGLPDIAVFARSLEVSDGGRG